jgi:hypothetical protein
MLGILGLFAVVCIFIYQCVAHKNFVEVCDQEKVDRFKNDLQNGHFSGSAEASADGMINALKEYHLHKGV